MSPGLPQKAGMPQWRINEVHGAWYDPSNPVVPMDGTLRPDLLEDLLDWEEKADLVRSCAQRGPDFAKAPWPGLWSRGGFLC